VLVLQSANDDLDWLMENPPSLPDIAPPMKKQDEELITQKYEALQQNMQKEKDDLKDELKSKEDEFTQLQSQLDMKEKDLQLLKHQLAEAVKQKYVNEDSKLVEQEEAMECLKHLVADNEAYAKCIAQQQNIISVLKTDNIDLTRQMNDTLHSLDAECDTSLRIKSKLKRLMDANTSRENNSTLQHKEEVQRLTKILEDIRAERQQLKLNLEERTHELDKTQNELSTIRGVVEYNLGSLDTEKSFIHKLLL